MAVIDAALARRFWPGESAVGHRLRFGSDEASWLTVVGVVGDVKHGGLAAAQDEHIYQPLRQNPQRSLSLVLHTAGDPSALIPAVRAAVHDVEPDQPIYNVRTLEQIVTASVSRPRFNMLLLAVFAGLAVLLAAVGIYGVLADAVVQRTREMGVRMALGARRMDVLRLVVGQGMALTGAGIGCGLVASLFLTRVLRSLLFGVSATDPATFAGVALLLGAVALLACLVPARRATRLDPLVALRHE